MGLGVWGLGFLPLHRNQRPQQSPEALEPERRQELNVTSSMLVRGLRFRVLGSRGFRAFRV